MNYGTVVPGRFLARPNRFIAHVELDGQTQICHVKNTGRCRELLVPGAQVYLEDFGPDTKRKTRYDLIAVEKGSLLINMDSQAPNKAVEEFLRAGGLWESPTLVRPETKWGNSRFDFYLEQGERKARRSRGLRDLCGEFLVKWHKNFLLDKGGGFRFLRRS